MPRSPERICVVQHLRGVRIVSREHGRSAWRTLGGGAEGVLEYRGFGGEGILVRRIEKGINESQGLPVLLVREDKHNIIKPARPCPYCMEIIRDAGVKKLVYTYWDGYRIEYV